MRALGSEHSGHASCTHWARRLGRFRRLFQLSFKRKYLRVSHVCEDEAASSGLAIDGRLPLGALLCSRSNVAGSIFQELRFAARRDLRTMTRINTNVSSLVAQNRLQASNNDLNTALTRLSTGLRINSGADDPAGLIASEALRSEITGLNKAISNTQRASQIISTADSALGQVSNLLNDVRGLVVEAANSGALSDDEIAANQLQIDSSLEAINRIAQTTTFQGRKLLDGGLSFQTEAGTNFSTVTDLEIGQANLGSTDSVSVDVAITAAAEQATVAVENIPVGTTATQSTGELMFTQTIAQAEATSGTVSLANAGDFTFAAKTGGAFEGAAGEGLDIIVATVASGTTSSIDSTVSGEVTITLEEGETLAQITLDLAANADFDFQSTETTAVDNTDVLATGNASLTGGVDAGTQTATLDITANTAGLGNEITSIVYAEVDGTTTPTASFNAGVLTVTVEDSDTVTLASIVTAIADWHRLHRSDQAGNEFTSFDPATTAGAEGALVAGIGTGGLAADVVFELQGSKGSEVFNVSAGSSIDDLVSQINLVADATGITAAADGTTLQLTSSDYGSDALVDLRVIDEAANGTFTTEIGSSIRDEGADIVAKVNGLDASGNGNTLSINTTTLDLAITVEDGSSDDFAFKITGGGAKFQLGSEVVGNQQARIGINSVNTARLGGESGKLFQLGSGGSASLSNDATTAAKIVTEAIGQVTGLRGRLGAFQATSLDSNLVSLNETKANLQEAESSIRDADFAEESAKLTRAQILVQSGTNVLSLANQNPQNVLALLR